MYPPLSYNDVRRAAQEATVALQTALNDLRNNIQNIKTDTSMLNDLNNKAAVAERNALAVQQLQQRVETHISAMNDIHNSMAQLHATHNTLQQRIANIEQLVGDMSSFLNDIHEVVLQTKQQTDPSQT